MTDTIADEQVPAAATSPRRATTSASDAVGADLLAGIAAWPLWAMLGWNDIRLRYRRSVLGPFWMTLSMAIFVVTLGFIYSRIFKMDIRTYLPFLALGFILWGFVSTTLNESGGAFLEGDRIIKQIRVPFSAFVFRVVWRNFIVLLHTIVLIVPIWIIFGMTPGLNSLLVVPGVALVYLNLAWAGIVVAILSTRFRDIPLIVATALQVTMFATPIMWPVSSLGDYTLIADANPFFHLIELVRAPLLGNAPAPLSWTVAIGLALVGPVFAALLMRRASRRIVYWL
ncbi:MAG: ABC transporter permease [Methylobacteriaceae bacterium]|nr:ABC transporter permease [Methylobacteriaceae bacterium]